MQGLRMQKGGKMSKDWLRGQGQNPTPKMAPKNTIPIKGMNVPTRSNSKAIPGFKPYKGAKPVKGTMQGMGAAKKGGKYTWI